MLYFLLSFFIEKMTDFFRSSYLYSYLFQREPKFSLFFPIESQNSKKYFIVELYRDKDQFFEEDEAMAESYMVWGNITLHYVKLSQEMSRQETINKCILNFAR